MLPNVELNKPEKTLNFTAVGHIQAGVVGRLCGGHGVPDPPGQGGDGPGGRQSGGYRRTGPVYRRHTPLSMWWTGLILDGLRMIYEGRHKKYPRIPKGCGGPYASLNESAYLGFG